MLNSHHWNKHTGNCKQSMLQIQFILMNFISPYFQPNIWKNENGTNRRHQPNNCQYRNNPFRPVEKNINKDMPMITSNSTMLQIAAVIFHTVTALGLMRFCGSRRKFFPPLSPSVKNYVSFRQKVSNI